jgi:hypothetical protein
MPKTTQLRPSRAFLLVDALSAAAIAQAFPRARPRFLRSLSQASPFPSARLPMSTMTSPALSFTMSDAAALRLTANRLTAWRSNNFGLTCRAADEPVHVVASDSRRWATIAHDITSSACPGSLVRNRTGPSRSCFLSFIWCCVALRNPGGLASRSFHQTAMPCFRATASGTP